MKVSRRAEARTAPTPWNALAPVAVGLGAALAGVVGSIGFLSAYMAWRVVTPSKRVPDTTIVGVDTRAQTITLRKTPDTILPGRYGLFTSGSESYVKVGAVLSSDADTVRRKLLTHVGADAHLSSAAAFSGWYFDRPEQLHVPFTDEMVPGPLGDCPAWVFPASGTGPSTWVIQVHGRGTTRAECLRAVPVFQAAGITSLLVSYRNDGDAPSSGTGTYGLGGTEWRDVAAAISFARDAGAERVIVMGWSMGGAIALQTSLNEVDAHIDGIILESPVIDWSVVMGHQARMRRLPSTVAKLAMSALGHGLTAPTDTDARISFDRLDVLARAGELTAPMLVLHSDDDGFVPSLASHELAHMRPDLVELQVFSVARHTKLWNYDQDRWSDCITSWLDRHQLATV